MFEVKEKAGMKGLFALKSFKIGEIVCVVEGEEIDAPSRTSVQVGINQHIDVKSPIMYINHNCVSNIRLNLNRFEAIRDIQIGDEIVFNYLENEDILSNPFVCMKCGNLIKGRKLLSEFPCGLVVGENVNKETLDKEFS